MRIAEVGIPPKLNAPTVFEMTDTELASGRRAETFNSAGLCRHRR
jgi:hypothetical protein